MQSVLAVVDDPLFAEHRAEDPHPERPERLEAARAALREARLGVERRPLDPRDASDDEIARVHSPRYVEALGQAAGKIGWLDADTYVSARSVAAARRAAGGAVAMVEALLGGAAAAGVAIVRPPGHHARPDAAMGFCLVNNVAVAAAHARALGAERVLVLDWDVHHGNGTQEMFYADPSVLYVSLHQSPFYPGTGAASEVGAGDGRGYNVNVPLSEGADDAVYAAAFDRLILPIAGDYDPDLLLVSAGFDAHHRDPLAGMSLSQAAYGRMVQGLRSALRGGGQGRIGLVLEGGYDLGGLRDSLRAALEALSPDPAAAAPTPSPAAAISERHAAEIARSVAAHAPYWKLGTGAAR